MDAMHQTRFENIDGGTSTGDILLAIASLRGMIIHLADTDMLTLHKPKRLKYYCTISSIDGLCEAIGSGCIV